MRNNGAQTKVIAALELLTATGIVAFWVLFFAGAMTQPDKSPMFLAHERGFVLPDLLLAGVLVFASLQLLRSGSRATTASLVAGGALAFLALYDFGWEFAVALDRSPMDRVMTTLMDLWLLGLACVLVWTFAQKSTYSPSSPTPSLDSRSRTD
jgi:hypothetical protein